PALRRLPVRVRRRERQAGPDVGRSDHPHPTDRPQRRSGSRRELLTGLERGGDVSLNRRLAAALLAAARGLVAGCGPRGPQLYPVTIKLVVDGGEVADLAGSTLDAAAEADPTVRASGTIEADGTVVLETLHVGKIRKGAQEGTYQARIVLSDDDTAVRRKA